MHLVYPERHVTSKHLPSDGYLYVYATAEVITRESAENGDADRRGWVTSITDSEEPVEHRNDAAPLLMLALPMVEDAMEEVADLVSKLGAIETDNGSTLSSVDSVTWDYTTDEDWMYCLHFVVKRVDITTGRFVEVDAQIIGLDAD